MRDNCSYQLLLTDEAIFATMKKFLVLGAFLVALASAQVKAQTSGPDVVLIRVQERLSGRISLAIERAGQETETVEFQETKSQSATKGYYPVVAKLYQQGYQLQGVIPGASKTAGFEMTESTLIFIKPVK